MMIHTTMINTDVVFALKGLIFQWINLLAVIKAPNTALHMQMFSLQPNHAVLAEKLLLALQAL